MAREPPVHRVIGGALTPGVRKTGRIRRLLQDIVEEDKRVRTDDRRFPARPDRLGPQAYRSIDFQGVRVPPPVGSTGPRRVWLAPVNRVPYVRLGRGRAERHAERCVIEAPLMAELDLLDKAVIYQDVRAARARNGHVLPVLVPVRVSAERYVRRLARERHGVDQRGAIHVKQSDHLAVRVQCEPGVEPGLVLYVLVRPHQQIAAGRDHRRLWPVRGNPPSRRLAQVIREIHPRRVNGYVAGVINLDPIVILGLRVRENTAVGGQQLIDQQVALACGADPTPHAEKRQNHPETSQEAKHRAFPLNGNMNLLGFKRVKSQPDVSSIPKAML